MAAEADSRVQEKRFFSSIRHTLAESEAEALRALAIGQGQEEQTLIRACNAGAALGCLALPAAFVAVSKIGGDLTLRGVMMSALAAATGAILGNMDIPQPTVGTLDLRLPIV